MFTRDQLFIGGTWQQPATTATIETISPFTEQVNGSVPDAQPADVDAAVSAARAAVDSGPWARMSGQERSEIMGKLSTLLQSRQDELASTITNEMGAPLAFSYMGQVFAATMVLDYFVDLASKFQFEELRNGVMGPAVVRKEPVGVAVGIVPWNVPLYISMLKLGPALASGSSIILKPSPEAPHSSFLLADAIAEAGVPEGVVSILPGGRELGAYMVSHPGVDKVSFTGSTAAGRKVAAVCGEQLKRVTLELGGKSAAILLDDVNIDEALPNLMMGAMLNNGQACVAQTRILVPASRSAELTEAIVEAVKAMPVGDPAEMDTQIGPLIADRQRTRVLDYIEAGKSQGATLATGGGRPDIDSGYFVEPTVFTGVDNTMKIAQEEIFGPVLSVIEYSDENDAVAIANNSDYGLSGTVFSASVDRGLDVARQVRTGTYTVNGFMLEPAAPFGGFKQSGIGRELGPEGLNAFLETKSISLPGGYEPTLRQGG
ncbi:MAG: aldehyde dehydrogenase [Actinobacteria bacterium]|nr:aldehyde dehydrogenase [Actinomycetota bacterium]